MTSSKTINTAVTDFAHAVGLLVRRVRATGGAQALSLTQNAVITRLAKEGPATTADLARAEGMKPQSMGTTLAALEQRGLIARTPHPTDGRQVMIALTDQGTSLRQSIRDVKLTWLAEAIARLNETDRETLIAATEIMQRLAEL